MIHQICNACETVAHCMNHGCIPVQPASTNIEAMRAALELCKWIGETPHQRGSINGKAAQVAHALCAALAQAEQPRLTLLPGLANDDGSLTTAEELNATRLQQSKQLRDGVLDMKNPQCANDREVV